MRLRAFALSLPLLFAPTPAIHASGCDLSSSDREWIGSAIETWGRAAAALERRVASMPWTFLYDQRCVVQLAPRGGRVGSTADAGTGSLPVSFDGKPVPIRSSSYRKRFVIPSGAKLTSAAVAFTSIAKDGETFFVMALPSVWKMDPRSMPGEDVEEFASGVLAHEMTHTIHLTSIAAAIDGVRNREPVPKSIDDDYLQSVFSGDTAYVAAYERELALYQRAVATADATAARELARQALDASEQRRARFFAGEHAFLLEVEPLFLNMEGVASWVAYNVVGRGGDPIEFAGRFWSQQEGLFLFLLDRFDSDWKRRVFDREVPSPFAMLRNAVEGAE